MGAEFKIKAPLAFFEKADAPDGQQLRIAGVVSTEARDRQKEIILQNGLDFSYFNEHGFFNDNHKKGADNILGYPTGKPKQFRKGSILPNGKKADYNCTWSEGYLLDTPRGRNTWENGKALQGTDRQIGFSLEGNITSRAGIDNLTATSAQVRNIAITECPVGYGTSMDALAKAMTEAMSDEELEKTLSMSTSAGTGNGETITPESLEKADGEDADDGDEDFDAEGEYIEPEEADDEEEESEDTISKSEFTHYVSAQFPFAAPATLERAVRTFFTPENGNTMSKEALEKALDGLDAATNAAGGLSRHQELLHKAQSGTISPDENSELIKGLSGQSYGLSAEIADTLSPSDDMQKSLDVSDMLTEQNDSLVDAMSLIAESLEKSESNDQTYRIAVGTTLQAMGEMIKSMSDRIDTMGGAPAAMVKSQVNRLPAEPLQRPIGDTPPQGQTFSKSQVMDAIAELGVASTDWKSPTGEDYSIAASSFEFDGKLSKSLAEEVAKHITAKAK